MISLFLISLTLVASEAFKLGQKVEVIGKDVQGVISYIGLTEFASGKWIGLTLDIPKGKNNGTVKGKEYFKCEENFGMFVKASQVVALDQHGNPVESPDMSRLRSRQSASRISLASSRQSLASSRQSLTGSKQSLAGSRSHLASPNVERPDNMDVSQIPKRASFVETNFVETLKPQFTPGQAITSTTTPISNVEDKLNNLQIQQEIENRELQIRDLNEKLATLKIKRADDKERTKDYDKLKLQLEQLLEFKNKIMESQHMLQKELQRAKQEAKEAIEARETHANEVADLSEVIEMATLDKEMAEEKAEALQLELEACREELEEVTLDREILKNELQEKKGDSDGSAPASSYEIKQLEQQNARLREALVRMRDLSAHDKHEHQKLVKDMDHKKSEIAELGKTKEKLSIRVEHLEQQISDLQEQVDAALGAEEMVFNLGEQKLSLEERVMQLQEEVAELEALHEMNEQLLEGHAEMELELREELAMAQSAHREAIREKEAAFETIADRDVTIIKFRDLVQAFRDRQDDLESRVVKDDNTSKPVVPMPNMDFQKVFSESKAHTKAIDLELRRMDVQQLQQHIKYLTSFMPDNFMNRGGDHDSILVLLLIPRMICKTDLLMCQIRDKFPAVEKIDRAAIIKGHLVEQFSFRCRLSYYIFALQSILNQYQYCLNLCKTETLLNVGANYTEMAAQEKVIDGFVELVKRNQLDENVQVELLEKCVAYFYTMYPLQMGNENKLNHTQLLHDNVKLLAAAFDGINTDALVTRNLIESANIGDISLLAQHIITSCDQLHQNVKLIKRRIPSDTTIDNLGLNKEVFENLYHCYQHSGKVLKTMHDITKNAVKSIVTEGDTEKGLSQDKIKDIAITASDKIYEQDDLGPVQSIKNSLQFVMTQVTQLAQFLQDNEYEINTTRKGEEKPVPTVSTRASQVKKDLEQTKTLTNKLEAKEADIKELRKAIKDKVEQLSEMTIRKELAEKKLGNVNKDYVLTIEKLKRKIEENNHNLQKMEKEFEKTMDYMQADIDTLESEKNVMKEKLKYYSSKSSYDSSKSANSDPKSLEPALPAVVKDSPLLLQEIENLRKLFNKERNDRMKLQCDEMNNILNSLAPLPKFKKESDPIIDQMYKEGNVLKQDLLLTLATPKFPAIYKFQPEQKMGAWQKHFAQKRANMLALQRKAELFHNKVTTESIKRTFGGQVESDFTVFPSNQMKKALEESEPVNIGFVKLPKQYCTANQEKAIVKLDLDFKNLQNILQTLMK